MHLRLRASQHQRGQKQAAPAPFVTPRPLSHEATNAICYVQAHHLLPAPLACSMACLQVLAAPLSLRHHRSLCRSGAVLICLVLADPCLALLPAAEHWVVDSVYAAWFLLCGAALLGLWSLAIYMSNVWTHFLYPPVKDS